MLYHANGSDYPMITVEQTAPFLLGLRKEYENFSILEMTNQQTYNNGGGTLTRVLLHASFDSLPFTQHISKIY